MRIQRLALNAAIACACTALGCAGATSGDMVPVAQPAPALTSSPARPGDVVRLRVWREPDLTGDFVIEETGMVVLPRLGPVEATAETAESLRKRVSSAFAEFLPHTSISVMVLRRVQILGAVRNPGLYPVDPTMTLGDALALAGGPTIQGKPNTVQLLRDGKHIAANLSSHTPIANSALRSGDQIFVPERSWLSRNAVVVSAAMTATVTLLVAFLAN